MEYNIWVFVGRCWGGVEGEMYSIENIEESFGMILIKKKVVNFKNVEEDENNKVRSTN